MLKPNQFRLFEKSRHETWILVAPEGNLDSFLWCPEESKDIEVLKKANQAKEPIAVIFPSVSS